MEEKVHADLRRFFVALMQTPEFVAATFLAFQSAQRADYSQEEHMQVIQRLRELDAREQATAEGYTRAIELGTRREVFEKLLTDIATERKRLQARKAALDGMLTQEPKDDPQEIAQIVAAYARDILEVLDSEMLTGAEKNGRLRRIVQEIRPLPEGYRVTTAPMFHTGHTVDVAAMERKGMPLLTSTSTWT